MKLVYAKTTALPATFETQNMAGKPEYLNIVRMNDSDTNQSVDEPIWDKRKAQKFGIGFKKLFAATFGITSPQVITAARSNFKGDNINDGVFKVEMSANGGIITPLRGNLMSNISVLSIEYQRRVS